jgi:hypothetical protein
LFLCFIKFSDKSGVITYGTHYPHDPLSDSVGAVFITGTAKLKRSIVLTSKKSRVVSEWSILRWTEQIGVKVGVVAY